MAAIQPQPSRTATRLAKAAASLLFSAAVFGVGSDAANVYTFPIGRRQAVGNISSDGLPNGTTAVGGGLDGKDIGIGLYAAAVEVGGQKFQVQLDTGSSDFLLVSALCTDCDVNNKYDPGSTAVLQTNQMLQISYLDGTGADFNVFTDDIVFAGIPAQNVAVGAIVQQKGTFESGKVDGLMGLAYPAISNIYRNTGLLPVLNQMVVDGSIENVFTMCFNGDGQNGYLTLGGGSRSDMKYSPFSSAQGFYSVGVSSVTVNGQTHEVPQVDINSADAPIIDTGTTSLVLGEPAFGEIQTLICGIAAQQEIQLCFPNGTFNPNIGVELTPEMLAQYPQFDINLSGGDAVLSVPPSSYFRVNNQGFYGIALQNGAVYGATSAILGDVALRGHTITFDRVHNQVGIVQTTTCSPGNGTAGVPPNVAGSSSFGTPSAMPSRPLVWASAFGAAVALAARSLAL